MKTKKIGAICLLACLLLGLIGNILPFNIKIVRANPDFVTETLTGYTIENDYFKVIFSNETTKAGCGAHGHILYFYIKPESTVNIVAPNSGDFEWLGGHECCAKNGTTGASSGDWVGGLISCDLSIAYQTSTVVVVKSLSVYGGSNKVNYTTTDYYIFYLDKPYYLGSIRRDFTDDYQYFYNHEWCFLFNDKWVSNYTFLNQTGEICSDSYVAGTDLQVQDAARVEQLPWWYFSNSTYGLGYGTILLSANPLTTYLGSYATSAGMYTEYQIHFGLEACLENGFTYATYLSYVTDDYNDIDTLSKNLYSNDVETTETFQKSVQSNRYNSAGSTYGFITTPDRLDIRPYATYLYIPTIYTYNQGWRMYSYYENATDAYSIFKWADVSFPEFFWNGSYTKVTYRNDYESKVRLEITTEMWNDSDVFLQTWNFTALKTLNVENFYTSLVNTAHGSGHVTNTQLAKDVIKVNASDYYQNWVQDCGITYQNLTGTTYMPWDTAWFYALNGTEQQINAGENFTIQLQEQRFHINKDEGHGWFTTSDLLSVHESDMSRFNVLSWQKFPLIADRDFRIKHYGHGSDIIVDSIYDGTNLKLTAIGKSGTTSNIQIYCGDKGKPKTVIIGNDKRNEGDYWSYNTDSKVLTITWAYESACGISLNWGSAASGLFNLMISVLKDGYPAQAVINLQGENRSIYGLTKYELPYGTYEVTVYCDGVIQTKQVGISNDMNVGFNFTSPREPLDLKWLAVPILIILAVALFTFLRKKH